MIQMSKLLMNSEFRKGAEELVEEFKKTGVDGVHSKVRQGYLRQQQHLDLDSGSRNCWRYSLICSGKRARRGVVKRHFHL